MIVLRSDGLLVRLDPRHGGEVLDLVDLGTGRQLLGRPPFPSLEPLGGELDEDTWTDRYRGGWQTVTPNAGNSCSHEGACQGFHGRASNDPWNVVEESAAGAVLRWSGHGVEVTRTLALRDGTLEIETEWVATAPAPASFLSVEHVTVGHELLAPSATITMPGGKAYELSEIDGPVRPPADTPGWPDVRLLDGTVERGDVVSVEEPSGRFLTVADVPEGRCEIVNDATGQGLRVEWDTGLLPHLWIWREVRASGGRWRGQAEMLGLEPASVPHSLGLARAAVEGQAVVLGVGERARSRIVATPFQAPRRKA
jgi:hypothetical protein